MNAELLQQLLDVVQASLEELATAIDAEADYQTDYGRRVTERFEELRRKLTDVV